MVTTALREQDVLFTAPLLDNVCDDVPDAGACAERFSELSGKLHRQAALNRSFRLRKIEALRRPAKG